MVVKDRNLFALHRCGSAFRAANVQIPNPDSLVLAAGGDHVIRPPHVRSPRHMIDRVVVADKLARELPLFRLYIVLPNLNWLLNFWRTDIPL